MSDTWWVAPAWDSSLRQAGITDFASAWAQCREPADGVNRRKSGWAAVHRITLQGAPDGCPAIFLKQQQNYLTRSARQPLGEPVAARELRNLRRFEADRLPVPQVVCHGVRRHDGDLQTLLGIAELHAYLDLDAALDEVADDTAGRSAVIAGAGALIGRLHGAGWEYRCLYPKHVFVHRPPAAAPRFSFIDLEKARRRIRVRYGALRDLTTFANRCPGWDAGDWTVFYRGYLGEAHSEHRQQQLMEQVRARRARRS